MKQITTPFVGQELHLPAHNAAIQRHTIYLTQLRNRRLIKKQDYHDVLKAKENMTGRQTWLKVLWHSGSRQFHAQACSRNSSPLCHGSTFYDPDGYYTECYEHPRGKKTRKCKFLSLFIVSCGNDCLAYVRVCMYILDEYKTASQSSKVNVKSSMCLIN
jgi:hypothetical protein